MCPEAVADLHLLVNEVRSEYGAALFYFVSGSMGGTGNLIYASFHPEDVAATVALCPVTDIVAYHGWCHRHSGGIRDEIRLAIESAYGGGPEQVPNRYAEHIVTRNVDRLTMPVFLSHATSDAVIPVQQSRNLHRLMANADKLTYVEIEGGDHDTPLHESGALEWLEKQLT